MAKKNPNGLGSISKKTDKKGDKVRILLPLPKKTPKFVLNYGVFSCFIPFLDMKCLI